MRPRRRSAAASASPSQVREPLRDGRPRPWRVGLRQNGGTSPAVSGAPGALSQVQGKRCDARGTSKRVRLGAVDGTHSKERAAIGGLRRAKHSSSSLLSASWRSPTARSGRATGSGAAPCRSAPPLGWSRIISGRDCDDKKLGRRVAMCTLLRSSAPRLGNRERIRCESASRRRERAEHHRV